jgi:hypothetical protein
MNNRIKPLVLAGWFLESKVSTTVIMQCRQNNTDVKSESWEAQERWYSVLRMDVMHNELQRKKIGNVSINLTLRCVCITIVTIEKRKYYIFWAWVCSLKLSSIQSASTILSFVACLVLLYFFHIISCNGKTCGKMLMNCMCIFIFSTTFVWNISHSKNNSARYHKYTYINI